MYNLSDLEKKLALQSDSFDMNNLSFYLRRGNQYCFSGDSEIVDSRKQEEELIKSRSLDLNSKRMRKHTKVDRRPQNIFFIEDAMDEYEMAKEPKNVYLTKSVINSKDNPGSKKNGYPVQRPHSLTSMENQNHERKKITINLRLNKKKLNGLKNVKARVQMRNPRTNQIETLEKIFGLNFDKEKIGKKSNKKQKNRSYLLRSAFGSSKKSPSLYDKELNYPNSLNKPSIRPFQLSIENLDKKKPESFTHVKKRRDSRFMNKQSDSNPILFDEIKGLNYAYLGDHKYEYVKTYIFNLYRILKKLNIMNIFNLSLQIPRYIYAE